MTGTVWATAPTYGIDNGKRHLLTPNNLVELGITWEALQPLLNAEILKVNGQSPDGISINDTNFGNYSGKTAATLGWVAYMSIGSPLIEELANIIQPPAEMLSNRKYVNRAREPRHFEDSVEFSISNTINWSLGGTAELTFGGRASATLEAQLQQSLQATLAGTKTLTNTHITHNHKDNIGTEDQTQSQASTTATSSATVTGTGICSGTGELFAQLMLGITGSVGGSLETTLTASSSVSGDIMREHCVETIATQRRQVKQYFYELPISLAGYVALHYAEPVPALVGESPPQTQSNTPVNLIALNIQKLKLTQSGNAYRPKGIAETVSALDVEHTIFASEPIYPADNQLNISRPHYL